MSATVCVEKKKICLLGTFAVGKTSLVQRFVHDRFGEKYLTTIGVDISQKRMPPVQRAGRLTQYHFIIWDIAGMDRFDGVVRNYYRGAAGALAVADLTRLDTAASLETICRNFHAVCPEAHLVFIGNKVDLFRANTRLPRELRDISAAFGGRCLATSAKTGRGVTEAFQMLAQAFGGS